MRFFPDHTAPLFDIRTVISSLRELKEHVKGEIEKVLSSDSSRGEIHDIAPASSSTIEIKENTATELQIVSLLLDELIEALEAGSLNPAKIRQIQRQVAHLDSAQRDIFEAINPILNEFSKRVWRTPGLPDFNIDKAINALITSLSTISDAAAFSLQADLISVLEGWPELATVNEFMKRFSRLSLESQTALSATQSLLLTLQNHLGRYAHQYTPDEIAASRAFQRCTLDKDAAALTDASGEIHDSRGSYVMHPNAATIRRGLEIYTRENRPSLRLYDETGDTTRLCLSRVSGKESEAPTNPAEFERAIRIFFDNDKALGDFACANLGIEAFMMVACENTNSLELSDKDKDKYISLFPANNYSISWHKLKDSAGKIYYQHRLSSQCHHLSTSTGKIAYLPEHIALTGSGELIHSSSEEHNRIQEEGERFVPLLSTNTVAELRLLPALTAATEARLEMKVVEHLSTILTPEIKRAALHSPSHSTPSPSPSHGSGGAGS